MNTIKVDLTAVYRDLQDLKAKTVPNYVRSDGELAKDRILIHLHIEEEKILCETYATNLYNLRGNLPSDCMYDYKLINAIGGANTPSVFINGIEIGFAIPGEADSLIVDFTIAKRSAFPLPTTVKVETIDVALALSQFKSDRAAKPNMEIIPNVNKVVGEILRRSDFDTAVLLEAKKSDSLNVITTMSCYATDGTRRTPNEKHVAGIIICQTVIQQSGTSKLLVVYTDGAYHGYSLLSLHGSDALKNTADSYRNKIGRPEYCVEV